MSRASVEPGARTWAWTDLAFGAWALGLVVFFGLRAITSGPDDITGPLGLHAALWVGGPSKLLAFALATAACLRSAKALGEGTPTRIPWAVLGIGFGAFLVAQGFLVVHQLFIEGETPYPSFADAAFTLGYCTMIGALVGFVRLYLSSGMLAVPTASLITAAVVAAAAVSLIVAPVEWAVLNNDEPTLWKLIGGAYPLLDAILIVLAALMIRITAALRGSEFAKPWVLLLAGFAVFTLGDAFYGLPQPAWITDPILDLCFAGGYLLCAWGSVAQSRLLRVES